MNRLDNLKKDSLPTRPPSGASKQASSASSSSRFQKDYSPLKWSTYFDEKKDVKLSENEVFRVYMKGNSGPVILFIHGGGFSALSWALLSQELMNSVECRCVAFDLRGHGDTHTADEEDFSTEALCNDIERLCAVIFEAELSGNSNASEPLRIILVGHSLGGALAVHLAKRDRIAAVSAVCVIDVVEGSAIEALASMQAFLRGRPKRFDTVRKAIEWAVRSGQIRNPESARISMLTQIISSSTRNTALTDLELQSADAAAATDASSSTTPALSDGEKQSEHHYEWRVDLSRTEPFWKGWFSGLSALFLQCTPGPKLLLLAGVDRLDRELTVAQMQGKFQMHILPAGHAIHEDDPSRVSDSLSAFLVRHKLAQPRGDFRAPFPAC